MKKAVTLLFGAVLALGAISPVAWAAADWYVNPGDSIQDVIDAAAGGDTIYVNAGTYDESVVIDGKDLSLIANGPVTLLPTSACSGHEDVIQVYNSTATIKGFTIDANYSVSGCLGGIYARGDCDGTGSPVDVTVRDNQISNYGKNGITVNCEQASAEITGNTVKGRGKLPLGDWAQNGIQIGWGATGTVRGNTMTDHWYDGCSRQDAAQGLCTYWVATGLLLYDVEPGLVKHAKKDNTFMRNQVDVYVLSSQSIP